jgi:hypothetical protein
VCRKHKHQKTKSKNQICPPGRILNSKLKMSRSRGGGLLSMTSSGARFSSTTKAQPHCHYLSFRRSRNLPSLRSFYYSYHSRFGCFVPTAGRLTSSRTRIQLLYYSSTTYHGLSFRRRRNLPSLRSFYYSYHSRFGCFVPTAGRLTSSRTRIQLLY